MVARAGGKKNSLEEILKQLVLYKLAVNKKVTFDFECIFQRSYS